MRKATNLKERASRIHSATDLECERQGVREEVAALKAMCEKESKLANSFPDRLEIHAHYDEEISIANHAGYILSLCATEAVDVAYYLPNLKAA